MSTLHRLLPAVALAAFTLPSLAAPTTIYTSSASFQAIAGFPGDPGSGPVAPSEDRRLTCSPNTSSCKDVVSGSTGRPGHPAIGRQRRT